MIRKLPKLDIAHKEAAVLREMLPHAKPRPVVGYTTLTQLAEIAGIQAQLARLYMKRAGIKRPKEGWRWKNHSRELTRACNALSWKGKAK